MKTKTSRVLAKMDMEQPGTKCVLSYTYNYLIIYSPVEVMIPPLWEAGTKEIIEEVSKQGVWY
jgi:hypothetical protein